MVLESYRALRLGTENDLEQPSPQPGHRGPSTPVYWRVEGSLLDLTTVRPVAFFTWNSQTFLARWVRRGLVFMMAVLRPFLYATNRVFATRVVHAVLRGVSRDRLDLLGEEYFKYKLKPHLKPDGVQQLRALVDSGAEVVLVSQSLDHVMRPLAQHLGVRWLIANRLEFRDRVATGRLLEPVIRPRGLFARIVGAGPDGSRAPEQLARELDLRSAEVLQSAVVPTERQLPPLERPIVHYETRRQAGPFSVRSALAGRQVLLVGVTGFIGKVWLVNTLMDLPEVGRIYLLIRRQKASSALQRFEKLVEESPVFDPLFEKYGDGLAQFLSHRVEVVEGDVTQPGLGLAPQDHERLRNQLDLVINSSGLTDFNPDLRDALATNVDAAVHVVDFVRKSDHAGLLHLSTCYVAGSSDGRVSEILRPNYSPAGPADFDAEREWRALHEFIKHAVQKAESPEVTEELRQQALGKEHAAKDLHGSALENQIRKNRIRWLRNYLTEAGTKRANELGWPNTYTLTKSLAESLIYKYGAGLPIAVVRPAIVETSLRQPFLGWNEGINTSASLSYLLGTYFRQLPSNERKRLDIIPVDLVCRGMTLVAAAVIARRNERLYQLATSVTNPCDMGRSIELTSLAHRKHYRAQEGLEYWLRLRFDAIPVSKERYNRMSAPAQKAIVKSIQRIMSPLPLKKPPLARAERSLERVEKLIELFEPFILHNEHDFVADNVEKLSQALVTEERAVFGYDTHSIDWWDYWINVHIPALRRWTYPLIEGRPLEARPSRNFQFAAQENGAGIRTGTNGASWRYS
ncbi:MAG TPA: SDR family oxidoreductase [Terriglobales bacterium]|jgi:long-chain acyl-CoA synthetase|nr:SDR family oxidoreductase [Terriglobales bacterium]